MFRPRPVVFFPAFFLTLSLFVTGIAQTPIERDERTRELDIRFKAEFEKARNWAARAGLPTRHESADGRIWELIRLHPDGRPLYYTTHNTNAAISTAVHQVRDMPLYGSPDGSNQLVGVWDGGTLLTTHQEFVGRGFIGDTGGPSSHAAHVCGTIGASGVTPSAKGMAPGVEIRSYAWGSASSEASAIAADGPGQSNRIKLSNHSYGSVRGWSYTSSSGTTGWHWFGTWGEPEDRGFGWYASDDVTWDNLCYQNPYYLPFWSAGNDRGDGPPSVGETFYYYSGGWQSKAYDPASDPAQDGLGAGGVNGYDSMGHTGKNVMVIGAVNDAVSGGNRSIASASMTSFSGWGPTDDGRIKPDIVANGASLYSTGVSSDTSYWTASGTSMSSPNATGSAVLLCDIYWQQFQTDMRASTLKALILHTADDIGNPGPDYIYGWGLMNTRTAADRIMAHAATSDDLIDEDHLNQANPTREYFLDSSGTEPLRVTISWTDPAGSSLTALDSLSPRLVNDLDLRLVNMAGGQVFQPWVLDPSSPTSNATRGDNVVDNVEQVYIAAPVAGTYRAIVSHKGGISGSRQDFSVIITGADPVPGLGASVHVLPAGCLGEAGLPQGIYANDPVFGTTMNITGAWSSHYESGFVGASIGDYMPTPLPGSCTLFINPHTFMVLATPTTGGFGEWAASVNIPDLQFLLGLKFRVQGFFTASFTGWGWIATPGVEATIGF